MPIGNCQLPIGAWFLPVSKQRVFDVRPIGNRQLSIGNVFMPPLKLAAILIASVALQLSLRAVWPPLVYIDFPLVVIVYIALQREAWQALVVATLAGVIVDAQSGSLIGASGFSKTLTAYVIYFAATKVNLENPLLRIPVLAAATVLDSLVYVFVHRLLSQPPSALSCRRSLTS